jgi:hypothetical protein
MDVKVRGKSDKLPFWGFSVHHFVRVVSSANSVEDLCNLLLSQARVNLANKIGNCKTYKPRLNYLEGAQQDSCNFSTV